MSGDQLLRRGIDRGQMKGIKRRARMSSATSQDGGSSSVACSSTVEAARPWERDLEDGGDFAHVEPDAVAGVAAVDGDPLAFEAGHGLAAGRAGGGREGPLALRAVAVGLEVPVAGTAAARRWAGTECGVVVVGVGDTACEGVASGPEAVAVGAVAERGVCDELVAAERLERRVVVAEGAGERGRCGSAAGVANGVGRTLNLGPGAFPRAAAGDAGAGLGEQGGVEVGGGGHVGRFGHGERCPHPRPPLPTSRERGSDRRRQREQVRRGNR
jgi:hypothetical protein